MVCQFQAFTNSVCVCNVDLFNLRHCTVYEYIHRVREKKKPRYFQLQLLHFLVDLYNFLPLETGMKTLQQCDIYLLKCLMTS